MKRKVLSIICGLSCIALCGMLSSCHSSKVASAHEIQADLDLRAMRSQIDDFKYMLNKYEVELQIVEGKADAHSFSINTLRHDLTQLGQGDTQCTENTLAQYDKKIEHLQTAHAEFEEKLAVLKDNTQEVLSSLAQFKVKIDSGENDLESQQRSIDHLSSSFEAIMRVINTFPNADGYVVCPGDTLEHVAKAHSLTLEEIKQLNNLSSKQLVVGQMLRIK